MKFAASLASPIRFIGIKLVTCFKIASLLRIPLIKGESIAPSGQSKKGGSNLDIQHLFGYLCPHIREPQLL